VHTFEGGCHCGRVRFRVASAELIALDCNCSVCTKKGLLHLIVPPEQLSVLQGEDALTTYRFNTGIAAHTFCRVCGVQPFYRPRSHPGWYDVNVRCLDDGAAARFEVRPFDGQHWEANVEKIRR
jgi:hypothetical protein